MTSPISQWKMEGGLFLPRMDNNTDAFCFWDHSSDQLNDLLDGGAHIDNRTKSERRQYRHDLDKPCDKILVEVARMDYERPDYIAALGWRRRLLSISIRVIIF